MFFIIAVASYSLPVLTGFLKYGRLTSYHTRGAVLAAYCIGAATVIVFAEGSTIFFRVATFILALAELEEIAITLTLPKWQANIPSLKHALEIKKGQTI